MHETKELAKYIAKLKYSELDREVVEKAKCLILDQIGCQLAFAGMPSSKAIYKYIRGRNGGRAESTVACYGLQTNVEDAAFANAVFGHGFEMDDTEMLTTAHPGVVVIPTAMAMGEAEMISGKDLITAVVAGYDVMLRAAMAGRSMVIRSFHTTSVAGTFGAAAAAGKILGFDMGMMLNALGIAGSQSGGIAEYTISGGSVKRLHAGFAAQAGVKAVLFAQNGISGPSTVLEGKKGFCQAFADEYYPEELTAELGKPYRIMWTGTKPYCCCAAQHTVIDAVAAIMRENTIDTDAIKEITVVQNSREVKTVGNIREPEDIVSAQFSGCFGVALRLIKKSNGFSDYAEKNLKNSKIVELVKKIKYVIAEQDDNLTSGTAPAKVMIRMNDGNLYQEKVAHAKGTIQNPMTKKELEDKFMDLASMVLPLQQAESIIQKVNRLEALDSIHKLTGLLSAR